MKCTPPVTHGVLFPGLGLTEALAEVVAEEERVVAEAARPFRLLEYPTSARPLEHLGYGTGVTKIDQDAAIPCPAPRLGGPAESSQQLGVVGGVYRLGRPLGTGPPPRPNPGLPAESEDLESGVVGDGGETALPCEIFRLGAGIGQERLAEFQQVFLGDGKIPTSSGKTTSMPVGSRRRPISCCLPPLRVAARIFTCPGPSAAPGTTRRCRARPDRAARRAGRGRTWHAPPCPAPPRISPDRS